MHLEERVMSASSISTGKPILPVPLSGQTFVFSSNDCESSICNQAHPATRGDKTHCSCEKSIGHSLNSSYNRLLLPAVNHKNLTSTSTISPSTYADSWLRFQHLGRTNYDSLVPGGFPLYGRLGNESFPALDYALLSNARRKNATRETTSVLKAWLNEHKKNPYPTKGEKVMLAIMTKMTLTQVSTWFANARRRLKKENKMTWLPKKKSGERKDKGNQGSIKSDSDVDDEDMDIDVSVDDNDKVIDSLDNKTSPVEKQQENESIPSVSDLSQSFKGELPRQVIQRPSVIRAVESPTFNQIKERFKDASSPVNSLQHWVNGCFAEPCGDVSDVRQLTPPATPIENQMTTFSEQKLFEIFDANRSKHLVKPPSACSSSSAEPLETLFSSKQPVCSVKETNLSKFADKSVLAVTSSTGVMTPQPSPKSESILLQCKNSLTTTITYDSITKPINSSTTTAANIKIEKPSITQENIECKNDEPKADVRVKGLTTSRELEAVLALTNLSKT